MHVRMYLGKIPLGDDCLGKHVVKYSGAPLEAHSSSRATLDSSLDRSFPSIPEQLLLVR